MRRFNIGDKVENIKSGVVGTVTRFYNPTASEEQTMVLTEPDKLEYHAPTSTWVVYQNNKERVVYVEQHAIAHGENIIRFANENNVTIAQAANMLNCKAYSNR